MADKPVCERCGALICPKDAPPNCGMTPIREGRRAGALRVLLAEAELGDQVGVAVRRPSRVR